MSFPTLHTERLSLRQISAADHTDMFQYLSDEEVMRHYGMAPFATPQAALDEVRWYQQVYDAGTGIRWGITLAGTNRVIGSCGFQNWDRRHNRIEVGYELAREHWGRGIMSEALQAALGHAFDTWQCNRVQALVEPENRASLRLLQKLCFAEEGLLRQYEFACGKYDDLVMLALLKCDRL